MCQEKRGKESRIFVVRVGYVGVFSQSVWIFLLTGKLVKKVGQ
jgi:hypothetical protein